MHMDTTRGNGKIFECNFFSKSCAKVTCSTHEKSSLNQVNLHAKI